MSTLQMEIPMYACSKCGKVGFDASNMNQHVTTVSCRGSIVKKFKGTASWDPADAAQSTGIATAAPNGRSKPGPKTVQVEVVLRGRIAARDSGDDARIDHLFATPGLAEQFLQLGAENIPAFMFKHMYGTAAPRKFRSIVKVRGMIHEVDEVDIDETFTFSTHKLTQSYLRDLSSYLLELAEAICTHSVPYRLPAGVDAAKVICEALSKDVGGDATLLEAVKAPSGKNEEAKAAADLLLNTLRTSLDDSISSIYDRD
jgi:hypothetical protein